MGARPGKNKKPTARELVNPLIFAPLEAALANALLTANLLGRQHVLERGKKQGVKVETFAELNDPLDVIPEDALAFLRTRVPLKMASIEALVRRSRTRSAAATSQLIARIRELLQQELTKQLASGVSLRLFQQRVPQILEQQGLAALDPHRIETIFRTNMNAAYNAGRVKQIEDDPNLAETFAWWQYNAVIDGRQRPSHGAMNGKVYKRDDPIWDTWIPPNGFN